MLKVAIIGLGQFGQALATALADTDAELIAIDRDPRKVAALRDRVTLAVCLDSTDEEALRSQAVQDVDVAVVGIGEAFESSVLTVAVLKAMGVARIIARAENDVQYRILTTVGADEIVSPEKESADRWSRRLTLPRLHQFVELGDQHAMIHVDAPESFCGKTLESLALRRQFGVNLVAIQRAAARKPGATAGAAPTYVVVPTAAEKIAAGDVLVLIGANEDLQKLPTK